MLRISGFFYLVSCLNITVYFFILCWEFIISFIKWNAVQISLALKKLIQATDIASDTSYIQLNLPVSLLYIEFVIRKIEKHKDNGAQVHWRVFFLLWKLKDFSLFFNWVFSEHIITSKPHWLLAIHYCNISLCRANGGF